MKVFSEQHTGTTRTVQRIPGKD